RVPASLSADRDRDRGRAQLHDDLPDPDRALPPVHPGGRDGRGDAGARLNTPRADALVRVKQSVSAGSSARPISWAARSRYAISAGSRPPCARPDFLPKPFTTEQLVRSVQRLL